MIQIKSEAQFKEVCSELQIVRKELLHKTDINNKDEQVAHKKVSLNVRIKSIISRMHMYLIRMLQVKSYQKKWRRELVLL